MLSIKLSENGGAAPEAVPYMPAGVQEICATVNGKAGRRRVRVDEAACSRLQADLATLLPPVQRGARVWLAKAVRCAAVYGLTVKIICGTRSWAEQDALYAQGRTRAGARVTNVRGGGSWHNYGLAFDIGLFDGGRYVTEDGPYKKLVQAVGVPAGFEWGGSWKSFKDYPHFQWVQVYGSLAVAKAAMNG